MLAHSITAAFVGLVALASAAPSPPSAPAVDAPALEARVWRSNIDVQAACTQQYGQATAVRKGNACHDWKCVVNGGEEQSVSMLRYCEDRFGKGNVYAACGGGTVWDWQCHDWF